MRRSVVLLAVSLASITACGGDEAVTHTEGLVDVARLSATDKAAYEVVLASLDDEAVDDTAPEQNSCIAALMVKSLGATAAMRIAALDGARVSQVDAERVATAFERCVGPAQWLANLIPGLSEVSEASTKCVNAQLGRGVFHRFLVTSMVNGDGAELEDFLADAADAVDVCLSDSEKAVVN